MTHTFLQNCQNVGRDVEGSKDEVSSKDEKHQYINANTQCKVIPNWCWRNARSTETGGGF